MLSAPVGAIGVVLVVSGGGACGLGGGGCLWFRVLVVLGEGGCFGCGFSHSTTTVGPLLEEPAG